MGWRKENAGFTIVELLIVVVVIAILAAVTTVSYAGITNRAYDTAVQSDLAAIARKYEVYRTTSTSSIYPFGGSLNDGSLFKIKVSTNAYDSNADYQLLNCTSSTSQGSDYAVLARAKSGRRFYVSSASGGVREYTGSDTWLSGTTYCGGVLSGSSGNGAGYNVVGGWRTWTLG